MARFKKLKLLPILILLAAITSCSNEQNPSENQSKSNRQDWIELGKKLENPYSVKNMRLALQNLKAKKASLTSKEAPIDNDFEIQPNYLYVEFQLKTELEEDALKADSSIILFDYPLDYEFAEEVLDTRPTLLPGEIPNYYSAIKIDSEAASEAHYQTLEQLYIPEEDPYFGGQLSAAQKISDKKESLLDELLDEAYKLTGNERQSPEAKRVLLPNGFLAKDGGRVEK